MDSPFSVDGFLSIGGYIIVKEIEDKYDRYIKICKEINAFAQNFQYKIKVDCSSQSEIIAVTLFSSILSTFQAGLMLSFRGMKVQASMLIRCMLEYAYPLIAISKNGNFANRFIESNECERLSTINKLIEYHKTDGSDPAVLESLRKISIELKQTIKDNNYKKLKTIDCAIAAGMLDDYNSIYSFTSDYVHATLKTLEQHLVLNKEGTQLINIRNEPKLTGWSNELVLLCKIMTESVYAISDIFRMEQPEILAILLEEMDGYSVVDNEDDTF